jgi:hypothetical protein
MPGRRAGEERRDAEECADDGTSMTRHGISLTARVKATLS